MSRLTYPSLRRRSETFQRTGPRFHRYVLVRQPQSATKLTSSLQKSNALPWVKEEVAEPPETTGRGRNGTNDTQFEQVTSAFVTIHTNDDAQFDSPGDDDEQQFVLGDLLNTPGAAPIPLPLEPAAKWQEAYTKAVVSIHQ